jgi:hypothetical protein
MSVLTDFSLLDYLHDARCTLVAWDCSDRSLRRVRLVAYADDDAEYEPWNGQAITITLSDVVMCRLFAFGFHIGEERIDAWRQGVSKEFDSECSRLHNSGIDIPPLMFTIVLGSGSTLELACREVSVEVGPIQEEASRRQGEARGEAR